MTEDAEAPEGKTPFEDQPLYRSAIKRLERGDTEDAAAKLNRLAESYPDDEQLRDQAVRAQLMAALGDGKKVRRDRGRPATVLRNVLVLLLVITLVVVGIAGFTAAYEEYVAKYKEAKEQEVYIASLRQEGVNSLQAGDTQGALQAFEQVLAKAPADPTAQAGVEKAQQQQEWDLVCANAQAADQQGDVQTALELYHQIASESATFCSASARIKQLEDQQSLDALWQAAQSSMQAGNWQDAISQLLQARKQDIDFHRNEAEALLFQAYTELAREQLRQANGNLTLLRQALGYLNDALALRPTDGDLLRERSLAQGVVSGFEAYAVGNWAAAVADWEPVYTSQPDYQDWILQKPLQEAYPKAAEQLIAQANGNVTTLRRAIGYLDKALATRPGDENLIGERQLASEYVAGADAAALGRWDEAIKHWSVVYAAYPDYQQGALKDQLFLACTEHPTASDDLCPP